MTIFVKTVGTLKSLEEETTFVPMDVPLQTSVSQIIERLNLNDWEVGFILVNGARGTTESILQEGDQLTLIAPLVGG
jgi:sulfur carrier protein ThiS